MHLHIPQDLLAYFTANKKLWDEVALDSVSSDCFVAKTVDKDGNIGTKSFSLKHNVPYALYSRIGGGQKMACATPLEVFLMDRVLGDEVVVE